MHTIFEFQNPDFHKIYQEQEDNNKQFKYSIHRAPEIYNYKIECWEIYVPYMLNYILDIIHPRNIGDEIYENIHKFKGNFRGYSKCYSKLPKYIQEYTERKALKNNIDIEKQSSFNNFLIGYLDDDELKNILKKVIDRGNAYRSKLENYVKDNTIMVRPETYTEVFDLTSIENNYWVCKNKINIKKNI